jgi:hypothetical protein
MMVINLLNKHGHEVRFTLRLKHTRTRLYIAREGLLAERRRGLTCECKSEQPPFDEILNIFSESAEWLHNAEPMDESMFEIESELANGY